MTVKKKNEPEPIRLLGRSKGDLKIGLVGLPNVGKSTTFNVLISKQTASTENYPFCTINPNIAKVNIPDDRFEYLCSHFKPKSAVPANLTVYDIAGLVPGAHKGDGLGNAFLSHINEVDGIYHVVRAFNDPKVIHTQGEVNPIADLETINDELRLKDIDRLKKILEDSKFTKTNDKAKQLEREFLTSLLSWLEQKNWIIHGSWKLNEIEILNNYQFLTSKPVVYLVNISKEDFIGKKNKWLPKILDWVEKNNSGPVIPFSAAYEADLLDLATDEHGEVTKKESSDGKTAIGKIATVGYKALRLIHYFTCGEDEVKCWTIREFTKAPQAAGIIHTDFEKGFISADVYNINDLKEHGSEAAVKLSGKLIQRGKDYIVQDGDIMFFKFNRAGGGKK